MQNAKWLYGVVVYSGHETKVLLNQNSDSSKESVLDKIVDLQIKIIFLLIFLLSLLCAIFYTWWTKQNFRAHWYLELKGTE